MDSMVYIFLLGVYYHLNLDVTKDNFVGGRSFPLSQRSFLIQIKIYKI